MPDPTPTGDSADDSFAAFAAQFRAYLENEVDWDPVIPPDLEGEERWQRICEVLGDQFQQAGRAALDAVPTLRRLDRDGILAQKLDLFDEYLQQDDFTSAISLFVGEESAGLMKIGNRCFEEGALAEARQVFAFAQAANPLAVEPLIGQITIEWEERGVERAADLYAAVVDVYQEPLLDMFAADCFHEAGQSEKASSLRERALEQVTGDGDYVDDYGHLAEDLRKSLA